MVRRKRLAVHLVGQQDVVESLGDGERAANVSVVDAAGDHARVEPDRKDVHRVALDARAFQHLGQSDAAPPGDADRSQRPLGPGRGCALLAREEATTVACALDELGRRVRGEPAQLLVGEFGAVAPEPATEDA